MRILVTGANGYIGSHVVTLAKSADHEIVTSVRKTSDAAGSHITFDLDDPKEQVLPDGIEALIHLAAKTAPSRNKDSIRREEDASRLLFEAAAKKLVHIVFVSSQTALEDAPTDYGRSKWRIEQLALKYGAVILRPGLVYGGKERALFGRLVQWLRRFPILPDFRPSPYVQPIHVDDLAYALILAASRRDLSGATLNLGAPQPVRFTCFLKNLAHFRLRRTHIFVPLPSTLASPLLSGSRLASLFKLQVMDTSEDMQNLGLTLRPIADGMTEPGLGNRYLLEEGKALLTYVLKRPPPPGLVRRYLYCLFAHGRTASLGLPRLLLCWPAGIASIDQPANDTNSTGSEFFWRLNAATMIAEASVVGSKRFLGTGEKRGKLFALLALMYTLMAEAVWRITGPLLRPFLKIGSYSDEGSL